MLVYLSVKILIALATVAASVSAVTYTNPLNQQRGADPCMRFINGKYYLTATQNANITMWSSPTIEGLKASSAATSVFTDSTAGRYEGLFVWHYELVTNARPMQELRFLVCQS